MYFVFLCENRTMKPVEIVVRMMGEGIKGKEKVDGGGESN
jgi:hypothetical protein